MRDCLAILLFSFFLSFALTKAEAFTDGRFMREAVNFETIKVLLSSARLLDRFAVCTKAASK